MSQQETISPFAAERAKLERQLGKLEQKRLAVMSALDGLAEVERRLAALDSPEVGEAAAIRPGPSRANSGLDGQEPSKRYMVIARVLREAGGPLTVPEISDSIARLDGTESNKNLRDIIHAICRRKPDLFERLRSGKRAVWRLRDAASPASLNETEQKPHFGHAGRNGHAPRADGPIRNSVAGDLTGMTVVKAAQVVLGERGGGPVHYIELAKEMLRRGYKSNRSTPFRATSVASILNGKRDLFENLGGGRFRLKET